jgi:hypothetical protein
VKYVNLDKTIEDMLQAFTGVLENGQIIWEEPKNLPKYAKVVVTVLEEIEPAKSHRTLGDFNGIWSDMDEKEKKSLEQHINTIRDEWERPI